MWPRSIVSNGHLIVWHGFSSDYGLLMAIFILHGVAKFWAPRIPSSYWRWQQFAVPKWCMFVIPKMIDYTGCTMLHPCVCICVAMSNSVPILWGNPHSKSYPYDPRSFPLYTSSYTSIAIKFIAPMIIALTMELIWIDHHGPHQFAVVDIFGR